jgi:integrase
MRANKSAGTASVIRDEFASTGVDFKVAQELLRHAGSRTTLDIYTRAVSQQKRDANEKVVEMMLPREMKKFQHPSAPAIELGAATLVPVTA